MEIIAITGILATLAVIVLVILRPWDGLSRLAAVYLFFTYRPRPRPGHARPRGVTRPPQGVWDDGPVPPIGSMDLDTELEYRAMAGLLPPERAADTLSAELRAAGPELDASGAAQRTSWAEPRPALLLLRGGGPERPPDGPGGGPQPPGPAERTDGQGVPPGGWRGQFDALAPPEPPYPLPWPHHEGAWLPRALPPWATEGGTWQIPAMPPPPEPELPPSGDWAPGTGPPEDEPEPPARPPLPPAAGYLRGLQFPGVTMAASPEPEPEPETEPPAGWIGPPDRPQVIRLGAPGPQSPDVHFQDDLPCWCGAVHCPEPESLRCPTCNSPQPSMHPATAEGGEVCHVCPDPFHLPAPEWAWQPSKLASPADREHAAELAGQDADAAEFVDRMAAGNRAYLWELRRGFLAIQGLI